MTQVKSHFTIENDTAKNRDRNLAALGLVGASAGVATLVASEQPAEAQNQSTTDIIAMTTDVTTIVGAVVGLGVLIYAASYGFKIVGKVLR